MAEFTVNTEILRAQADKIITLQREISSVTVRLTGLQLGSVMRIQASTLLLGKVTDCKWATVNQSDNLNKLAVALRQIADLYEQTENRLKDPKTQQEANRERIREVHDWVVEHFGNINGLTAILAMVSNLGGDMTADDLKGFLGNCAQVLGTVGACFESGSLNPRWFTEEVLGFGNTAAGLSGSFDDFLQQGVDDFNFGSAGTAGERLSVAAKWIGAVVTVGFAAYDNYQEFGGELNGRMVAETALESVTDIGMDILVGAGVATACVAAIGSAPAVLVAAGTAVVTVGANWACEQITYALTGEAKDLGEVVADTVCDTYENVAKAAGNIGKALKDGFTAGWKAICG